jgi:hypothetical protein
VHTACKDRGVSFFLLLISLCSIRLKSSNPVSKHWCLIGKGVKKMWQTSNLLQQKLCLHAQDAKEGIEPKKF